MTIPQGYPNINEACASGEQFGVQVDLRTVNLRIVNFRIVSLRIVGDEIPTSTARPNPPILDSKFTLPEDVAKFNLRVIHLWCDKWTENLVD